jgi:L-fuconolactonase
MNHRLPRRDFLKSTAASSLLMATGAALPQVSSGAVEPSKESPMSPIIDPHQHLWDLKRFRLPWTDGNEKLTKNFLIPEYMKAIEGTGIERALYMEVGMALDQQVAEAEWLIDLCENQNTITQAGVIAGQPFEDEFTGYVDRFSKYPCIKGVRHLLQIPESPQGMCLEKGYQKGVQYAGDHGLRFDICIRPTELSDAITLAKSCPETQFILDHCGNADPAAFGHAEKYGREPQHTAEQWKRDIEGLSKQPNVVCKISGIIARVVPNAWSADDLAPIVDHCLESFGPERVIFASDWPVCTLGAPLKAWVAALREIVAERPVKEQAQLFSENSKRIYSLAP